MRVLLLGAATIALSGCSWLGLGGKNSSHHTTSSASHGQYTQTNASCVTGQCLSRWNVEGGIGFNSFVGGTAISGQKTHANANPGTSINNISLRRAYDRGVRGELGVSYALNPNRKVTATGFYQQHAGNNNINLGTLNNQALQGSITDHKSFGGEVGLRQYFAPSHAPLIKSVRPYIEGRAGVSNVDDIGLFDVVQGGNAYAGGSTIGLYEGGWVPTAAGLVGIETPLTKYSTIGLETGIRYSGNLKSDDTNLNGASELAGINSGKDSWSVPLMLRGRYRF